MTYSVDQVRQHLRTRIEQAREWADNGFPGTQFGPYREMFRGGLYDIRPVEFLDNGSDRKQRYGIRFAVVPVISPTFVSYVDVLISPEFEAKEGPVIKVKAVSLADGQEVNPRRDIISPYVQPDACIDEENIDAFFKKWLRRAFSTEHAKAEKILDSKYPAE